jgi:drug/metabolite transporter (DMT)-like permease
MALVSRLAFNDVVTRRHLMGILVSLPGAAILIAHGDLRNLMDLQFNGGDLWMLGAVLAWTAFSVLLKRTPAEVPKATLLTAAILVGLGALMPIYAWRLALGGRIVFTASSVAGILYVGLFASVLAFYFWSKGIAQVGPSRAGMYMHIMPLAGTILSIMLLGEDIALFHLVGAGLVFTGIAITNWLSPGARL